jgi:hypothetical protein
MGLPQPVLASNRGEFCHIRGRYGVPGRGLRGGLKELLDA